MKKNIVILTILTFLCLSGLLYGFVEIVYNERVSLQETSSESNTVSFIELISPEIKTAVMKDDDIALLYSIEKLSKVKTVKEAFILDKDLNVVIHNDSSKWNKKYNDNIYKNIVSSKNKSFQKSALHDFIYSQPLNDNLVLCVNYSLQEIFDNLKMWKIKLYVYGFIIAFLILLVVYNLAKFFFLGPLNKTKKYLSVNETKKKTIYSEIVNMALACGEIYQNEEKSSNEKLRIFTDKIFKNYLNLSDDIFILLDDKARLVYCVDEEDIVLQKQEINSHIVNLTRNSEVLKNISTVLEKSSETVNMDIAEYKINITPIRNEDKLVGIIISGNKSKE